MKYLVLFILLLSSFILYNEYVLGCPADFKLLEPAEPAPCKGYFLSEKKEKEVRYKLLENDLLKNQEIKLKELITEHKKYIDLQTKELKLVTKEKDMWKQQAYKSTEALLSQRDYGWLYFIGGIVTTIAIGKNL